MKLDIKLAETSDKKEILDFIGSYWQEDHIYLSHPSLLDYLHLEGESYNIVVVKNKENNQLLAIHAFIPYENFDGNFINSSIFLSIWKVAENINIPGLGLRTIKFIENNLQTKPSFIEALGFTKEVSPLYRRLGYKVGKLSHFVLINPSISEFNILNKDKLFRFPQMRKNIPDECILKLISPEDFKDLDEDQMNSLTEGVLPEKSKKFIASKYLNHPFYDYKYCLCVDKNEAYKMFFVYRKIEINNSNVLRIVDFMGSEEYLKNIRNQLYKLIVDQISEYMDIYHYGLKNDSLEEAGFINRYKKSGLIIPNHFEPFERINIDIRYAFLLFKQSKHIRLFKGDGDQDRPSLI